MAKAKSKRSNPFSKLKGDLYYGLLVNGTPYRMYNKDNYDIDLAQDLTDLTYWDAEDFIKLLKKYRGKITVEVTKFKRVIEKA